jgi:hypothetical protein
VLYRTHIKHIIALHSKKELMKMPCCKKTGNDRETTCKYLIEKLPGLNRGLPRMGVDMVKAWIESDWPIYHAGDTVAFHAPVGNTSYFNNERPAKIIISGFCVAGNAGFKYVRSSLLSADSKHNIEAAHTFATPTMIRGMHKIIELYGLHKVFGLSNAATTFEKARAGDIPLMMTQALCPIISDWSSKATDVWRELKKSPELRCFAGGCLNWWWNLINNYSNDNTEIMLMGSRKDGRGRAELNKLLAFSRYSNNFIEIKCADQKQYSVLFELEKKFAGRVSWIKHAAWHGRS